MKMVDLELDDKQAAEETAEAEENEKPKFPWGTQITLNHETLEKLKMNKLPEMDTYFEISAIVCVVGVNQHELKGETESSVTLQIHELGLAPYKENYFKKMGKKLYPDTE